MWTGRLSWKLASQCIDRCQWRCVLWKTHGSRKRVYGMTLMLMDICPIAFGLSFGKDAKAVTATLCFFHFRLGFDIGGDYPLSATILSEYANKKTPVAFIASFFVLQGFGILADGIVAIIISAAFKAKFHAQLTGLLTKLVKLK
uniref:Uncharacterized protein n=1 Tax=Nelumbo nucifera TaxID=4432 RepID=A0A822XPQ0_NELNU|nr:TPA_asm: hypothetical protein HUJ06_022522 [Nelumbo nucifera]